VQPYVSVPDGLNFLFKMIGGLLMLGAGFVLVLVIVTSFKVFRARMQSLGQQPLDSDENDG
jgi:hypothetical protein